MKLLADEGINFFFTKVTAIDQHLEEHFETLATFWEQSLFLRGGYFTNMFTVHKEVHEKYKQLKSQLDQVVSQWEADEMEREYLEVEAKFS